MVLKKMSAMYALKMLPIRDTDADVKETTVALAVVYSLVDVVPYVRILVLVLMEQAVMPVSLMPNEMKKEHVSANEVTRATVVSSGLVNVFPYAIDVPVLLHLTVTNV